MTEAKVVEMIDDKRPITTVLFNDERGCMYQVGMRGCTKIVVYGEPGEFCMKPWVAVYAGEEILTRIPAGQVQIVYSL